MKNEYEREGKMKGEMNRTGVKVEIKRKRRMERHKRKEERGTSKKEKRAIREKLQRRQKEEKGMKT